MLSNSKRDDFNISQDNPDSFDAALGLTDGGGVVLVPQQDLGGGVGQRPAGGAEVLPGAEAVAEAKVGELNQALLLEEHHVLRLQVAVHHPQPVAVGDGVHDLGEVALGQL